MAGNKLILNRADQAIDLGLNAQVVGSSAVEIIRIAAGNGAEISPGSGDRTELPGSAADYTVAIQGNTLVLTEGANIIRLTIGGSSTVAFADGEAVVDTQIDLSAGAINLRLNGAVLSDGFNMSTLSLDALNPPTLTPGTATVANKLLLNDGDQALGVTFDTQIVGSSGAEQITVAAGNEVSFSAGTGDKVTLSGNLADYTVTSLGNTVTLRHADGSEVELTAGGSSTLAFADGDAVLDTAIDIAAGRIDVRLGGEVVDDSYDSDQVTLDNAGSQTPDNDTKDTGRIDTTLDGDDTKIDLGGGVLHRNNTLSTDTDLINIETFRSNSQFSGIDGSNQTIVVIDSAFDMDHPFFGNDSDNNGIADRIVYQEDFTNEGDGNADSRSYSTAAHGTNVASIIGSSDSAYSGIAPGVNLVFLQALTDQGGQFDWIEKALEWVVDNAEAYNVAAVNMSLGDSGNNNFTSGRYGIGDQMARLDQMGVITVAAAGNDYGHYQTEGAGYPATDPHALAVGAVFDAGTSGKWSWSDAEGQAGADRLAPFSQRSTEVADIFAPGAPVYGAAPGGGVGYMTGTSQATPIVAGAVALAQQLAEQELGRRLSSDEFANIVRQSSTVITDGDDEDDNVANTGDNYYRIDINAMAEQIAAMDGSTPADPADPEVPVDPGTPADPAPQTPVVGGSMDTAIDLAIGSQQSGAIDSQFENDWYRVELQAGTEYTFNLNGGTLSDTWLSLHDAQGTSIAHNDDSNNSLNSEIVFTPADSGSYFLNAKAYYSGTGTYSLLSTAVVPEQSDDLPADFSTPYFVSGISTSVTEGAIDFEGDSDWIGIEMLAGYNYTLNLKGGDSGSGTLADPVIRLFNAEGDQVGYDDDSGTSRDSSLLFQPEGSGVYYIEADAWSFNQTGTYQLEVIPEQLEVDIPEDISTTASLGINTSVNGNISYRGDEDWFAIELVAGNEYQFDLVTNTRATEQLRDTYLSLYGSGGDRIAYNDDTNGLNSQITFTPAVSGTYYLGASGFGTLQGEYTLSSQLVHESIPDPVNNSDSLELGLLTRAELSEVDEVDLYSIELQAGTMYRFHLDGTYGDDSGLNTLGDPLMQLFDANMERIAQDDDGGTGLNSELSFTPTESGTYYVGAGSFAGYGTGIYSLYAEELGGGTADIMVGQLVSGELSQYGEEDSFSVNLIAGHTYEISLAGNSSGAGTLNDPLVHLLDYDNLQLASNDDGGVGFDSLLTFTASYSGQYQVVAGAFINSYIGTYALQVVDVIGTNSTEGLDSGMIV